MLKALVVTDMHYTDIVEHIGRYHSISPLRLKEAFDNKLSECDFVLNLGDTADDLPGGMDQELALREMAGYFKECQKNYYTVIGNHDTAMEKHKFCEIIGMPHRYYSFEEGEFKFIVLDASMNSKDAPYPEKEMNWRISYIDDKQIKWLQNELENTDKSVFIIMHELLYYKDTKTTDDLVVINRDEVIEVLEKSGKVKAIVSGHWHQGDLVKEKGKIPQITLCSMAEGIDTSYSVLTFEDDKLSVEGFGRQPSYEVSL